MNVETIREYCLSKKGVTESFPFDNVCDPERAIELREHYAGIEGAYHFNKKYWNGVYFDRDVDDKLIKELVDHSYEEVIKKFTKKLRAEYDALP